VFAAAIASEKKIKIIMCCRPQRKHETKVAHAVSIMEDIEMRCIRASFSAVPVGRSIQKPRK
jgi:hypothetical protein